MWDDPTQLGPVSIILSWVAIFVAIACLAVAYRLNNLSKS